MCSKPEVSVRKIVQSDRTKIYADDSKMLTVALAGRFKGTSSEFEVPVAKAIARGELLQGEDKKGKFYESVPARTRRLAESSKSPKVGYVNAPSLATAGASR